MSRSRRFKDLRRSRSFEASGIQVCSKLDWFLDNLSKDIPTGEGTTPEPPPRRTGVMPEVSPQRISTERFGQGRNEKEREES